MVEKYYKNKTVPFDFYGYAPPGCEQGDYRLGQTEVGFRTAERYREYKDAGFNMVMSGTVATYYGEEWESSMCKRTMDAVYAAGIDKYIVGDQAIYELSCQRGGVIGEGKRFESEEALDKFIAERMKDYSAHPAFGGVYLKDEPHYYLFKSFGQIYRSVKRVCPKAYVYCNLLPLDTLRWMDERYPQGGDLLERRRKYLNLFLDETGADYIMYDDYTFCYAKENKVLLLRCLQDAAALCRERGKKLYFVAQSFSMNIGGKPYYWVPNEQEMRYQLHLLMGFGVKSLGFFTYMTHGSAGGEEFPDDGAMLNLAGEKMPLYDTVQKVIGEVKEILPVVTRFSYQRSAYAVRTFSSFLKQLDYALNEELENVTSFETDREGVLINELYDEENKQYLYRIINMTDVRCEKTAGAAQKTTVQFKDTFTKADVFENGKWHKRSLQGGKLEVSLLPGDSVYVMVY